MKVAAQPHAANCIMYVVGGTCSMRVTESSPCYWSLCGNKSKLPPPQIPSYKLQQLSAPLPRTQYQHEQAVSVTSCDSSHGTVLE